jgi:hypothetical protein
MSPIITQSRALTPRIAAALRMSPGAGLRHAHPSSSPCGHTAQTSNGPRSDSTLEFTSYSSSTPMSPLATPDWLVTTPIGTPARRIRFRAVSAPGMGRTRRGSRL